MTNWLLCCVCVLCATGCGGETEGRSITLRWVAGSAAQAEHNREFTTDTGWDVSLDAAFVAVGPVVAIAPAQDELDAVAEWIRHGLVSVAHAHGGHDAAGGLRVRAELLDPVTLDALSSESVPLQTVEGEEGAIDTIKLEIAQRSGRLSEALHGHQAYVRGRASRGSEAVQFEGGLVALPDDEPSRRVETDVDLSLLDGGELRLNVNVVEWFRHAEFDQLSEPQAGVASISDLDQVGRAWKVGVRTPAAFDVSFMKAKKD